jgi:hypothetical protein
VDEDRICLAGEGSGRQDKKKEKREEDVADESFHTVDLWNKYSSCGYLPSGAILLKSKFVIVPVGKESIH